MKKLLIAIGLFIILISGVNKTSSFTLLDYFEGEYNSYSETKIDYKDCVNLGFCYMYNEQVSENVIGESVKIKNFEPGNAIKVLKAKVVKTEYLDNETSVIYAYSSLIENSVEVDNKKVNIQIAHNDEFSVIGWPLILGSF